MFWEIELIQFLLGHEYDLYDLLVSPSDAGFTLVERKRRYIVGVHRRKASVIANPVRVYQTIVVINVRPLGYNWELFAMSTECFGI